MKSVLISIQPKWCELIASGKKTIEVRKSRPQIETPFKCLVYCTKGYPLIFGDSKSFITDILRATKKYKNAPQEAGLHKWNGKVIGEFVCDKIDEYTFSNLEADYRVNHIELDAMRLNHPQLIEYGKGKPLYGWHISNLKIYDKPKELSEFYRKANCVHINTGFCKICANDCKYYKGEFYQSLTCPFQSWGYVEGQ